ncbi:family 10 glycosylhydrolase [uncultured Bacteroides sp.]|uniref:glycoside hydrolase family 10 protein n=1 Tax=uncultured Bacteroides sp. TaxID=162156 RepID=UPI00280AB1E5|nr:family 10 glycosylhydrolase [uncultured Bacteroides sp.]
MRILICLLFISCSLFMQAQPKEEIRATWLTTLGGMDWPTRKANSPQSIEAQKNELIQQLDALQAAHFNTVLFQTRLRGDVVYPSAYETFAESLTGHTGKNPGYDPLQFAIEECHKRGLELHAWLVCIPIGNKRQVGLLGKDCIVKKQPKLCKQFNGSWYLDPGNPGTAEYLSQIAKEIVSRYDVDGIHLDYIRYPEQGEKFPDKDTYRKYGKKQDLKQWRRDNITRIVRRIYTEVKRLKPWVKVSSSPIGKFNDTRRYSSFGWNAYETVYQDAQKWLNEGIQDALFPMMYFQGNHFYPFALDWKENKNDRWIIPGLGIYFLHPKEQDWKIDEIIRQIYFSRKIGLDGQAYFRNKFILSNTKGILDELQSNFYVYPAVVPPMRWTSQNAPSQPTTPHVKLQGENIQMSWKASESQPRGIYYRVYASDTYPVDTEKAQNLILSRTDSCQYTFTSSPSQKGGIYWAVTAVNRFGFESAPLALNTPAKDEPSILYGRLPILPKGYTLIVSEATGIEILRTTQPEKDIPRKIGKGFFRLSLLAPDGSITPAGVTVF